MLMKDLIAAFPEQMRQAVAIGEKASLTPSKNEIRNVFVSGLGGSGIGGTIMAQITDKQLKVPFVVNCRVNQSVVKLSVAPKSSNEYALSLKVLGLPGNT